MLIRTASTRLAEGCVCRGCGKVFASQGRLRRHLSNAKLCRERWGAFSPTCPEATAHPQMFPVVGDGVFDCDFLAREPEQPCPALTVALRELGHADASAVLQEVSRFAAPIAVIRDAVESWRDGFPADSSSWQTADSALQMLHPRHLCETIQPTVPECTLDPEEYPILGPVSPFKFSNEGRTRYFAVSRPPCPHACWPWEYFGPLKTANALAAWAASALQTCREALEASAAQPVAIAFGEDVAAAVPQVAQWFVQGGFVRVGDALCSPVSPEFNAIGAS